MNKNEEYALAACAIIVACMDDNLRDLSAKDRQVALAGRAKAWVLLQASGIQPTELKELGVKRLEMLQ